MPKCGTLSTFEMDMCQNSLGGVKKLWFADWADGAAQIDELSHEISGFTSGVTFYELPIKKNTANYSSNLTVNEESGNFWTTTLTVVLPRMETAKKLAIDALALTDSMWIAEDANGNKVFLGRLNPCTVSAGTGETGTAKTDRNAYSFTITDDDTELPVFLKSDCKVPTGKE